MMAHSPADTPAVREYLVVVLDVAGYAARAAHHDDLELASFLDAWYRLGHRELSAAGARVVKYIGDALLAVAPPDRSAPVVGAVEALVDAARELGLQHGMEVVVGANLHVGEVVAGPLGPEGTFDVIGREVNHAFAMGRGGGIRISEPVYRLLGDAHRGVWHTPRRPATYHRA